MPSFWTLLGMVASIFSRQLPDRPLECSHGPFDCCDLYLSGLLQLLVGIGPSVGWKLVQLIKSRDLHFKPDHDLTQGAIPSI
jgi:hypothetical protein